MEEELVSVTGKEFQIKDTELLNISSTKMRPTLRG